MAGEAVSLPLNDVYCAVMTVCGAVGQPDMAVLLFKLYHTDIHYCLRCAGKGRQSPKCYVMHV